MTLLQKLVEYVSWSWGIARRTPVSRIFMLFVPQNLYGSECIWIKVILPRTKFFAYIFPEWAWKSGTTPMTSLYGVAVRIAAWLSLKPRIVRTSSFISIVDRLMTYPFRWVRSGRCWKQRIIDSIDFLNKNSSSTWGHERFLWTFTPWRSHVSPETRHCEHLKR